MHKLKHLLPYFRPYTSRLVGGVIAILFGSAIGLAAPLIVGGAIDSLKQDASARTLLLYGAALLGVTAGRGLFSFVQRMILVTLSRQIEFDLRDDIYRHLQTLQASFFHRYPTGDLMARASNDVQAVRMLCGPAIMYSTQTLFTAIGTILLMLRIDVGLSLLAFAALPLVAGIAKIFGQRIHVLFQGVQESFSDLTARVQESLAGARVVRAYAREQAEEAAFDGHNRENLERNRRLILWNAAFHPLLGTTVGLGFAAVLGYGGQLMVAGDLTVGQFVTFQLFLARLVWPMIAVGWVINLAQRGAASMGRLQDILGTAAEIVAVEPIARPKVIDGDIEMRQLDFRYRPELEPALEGVSLDIAAGRTVALVGRTGSGKSTLLNLVPRLIDPPAGTLFIDGTDVRHLPLDTLRQSIAMVPQETFLFSATLRDNIIFGRPEATDAEALEVASLAGLAADLSDFPKGLDTIVGERGITLSGGQKQRVALARAILRQPQILLLDDCLSAVDSQTEETILRNLRQVLPGRTVLIASHRIAAARLADDIVVLDGGRIEARGDHDELVVRGGTYADLYYRQRLEDQLEAV